MRLGQLARKLAISPTEIIKFLESNSVLAAEGSNTRLANNHIRLVLQQFDPAGTISFAVEQTNEVASVAIEAAAEMPAAPVADLEPEQEPVAEVTASTEETANAEEAPDTDADAGAPEDAEVPGVIKAPKVALAGLKVLGKIELPEPRKKEPAATPENTTTPENTVPPIEGPVAAPQERRPRREGDRREGDRRESRNRDGKRSNRNDNRRGDNPRRNTIALQREREANEAQLKKEAQAKAEKDRRTQHYHNKVKTSVPSKPSRLLRDQVVEMTEARGAAPNTWIGKFWRWFRS